MINFEMKDLTKKPNIYYISAVGAGLLWLIVSTVFVLPNMTSKRLKEIKLYKDVDQKCSKIFEIDPARINYAESKDLGKKFDYSTEINEIAGKWGIRPDNYDLRSQKPRLQRGGVSQEADIMIKEVTITNLAEFLSELLDKWPDLSCENLKVTAVKDEPDLWKVTIKFKYNQAS